MITCYRDRQRVTPFDSPSDDRNLRALCDKEASADDDKKDYPLILAEENFVTRRQARTIIEFFG